MGEDKTLLVKGAIARMNVTFEQFIASFQRASAHVNGLVIKGPLLHNEYTVLYVDQMHFTIFPHVQKENGQTAIDIICMPQRAHFDLVGTYNISELLYAVLPGGHYLLGESMIGRFTRQTACIRISLQHTILQDLGTFMYSLEFLRDNGKRILRTQLELA